MQNDVVDKAREYLDVRFQHQGRNRQGLDCAGLVIVVANDLGKTNFDVDGYSRRTLGDEFVSYFDQDCLVDVDQSDIQAGDILVTEDAHFPCHCGIVSMKRGQLHFIHAYLPYRKVVEVPLSHWKRKIIKVKRFV